MRDATLRTDFARVAVAILAIVVAVLCNLAVSHSARALSLSNLLDNTVKSIPFLDHEGDNNHSVLKSTTSIYSQSSVQSFLSSKKQKSQPSSVPPAQAPAPEVKIATPTPLTTIASIDVATLNDQQLADISIPFNVPMKFDNTTLPTSGDHTFALIRPTEQGWKILDVLWYWWTPAIAALWLMFSRLLTRAIHLYGLKKVVTG